MGLLNEIAGMSAFLYLMSQKITRYWAATCNTRKC